MRKSRFLEEQIITILKEQTAGMKTAEVCRRHRISQPTFYLWKSKYGDLEASELKRIKELEAENAELKRMYADTSLERDALKKLLSKKLRGR